MMEQMGGFEVYMVALLHVCCSFAYYLAVRRGVKFQAASEGLIVFLLPVFGLLFLLSVKLYRYFWNGRAEELVPGLKKEDWIVLGGNLQIEADIIPLSDALFIEDTREKRALLTNAIKQNVLDNSEILRRALRDPDREVSHYAVSMLTHQIEKAEAKLLEIEQALAKNPDDGVLLRRYREAMKGYLKIDFLDEMTKRRQQERYAALLLEMLRKGIREKAFYEEAVALLLMLGRLDEAERVCGDFAGSFPEAEEMFISYMSLYWEKKDFEGLQETIRALKACPIQLTARVLEIIRFWDRGRSYV